jgi:glucosylceramidase
MKTNGEMNHGGKLRPEYRDAWARHYVRFIQAYRQEGIDVWAITVQNEPAAVQSWDSCIYTPEEERHFVRDHLGPAMEKAGLGHVKIIVWDHNRDWMVKWASTIYGDPGAAKYVWGTGIHWYGDDMFHHCALHHDLWPEKAILFTEGCQEGGPHTGEWMLGERYGKSMINDFNRWVCGWVDWNLLLDEKGGPNHVGNYCSAPILADTVNDRLLFQNSYYYIGHFARFVRPGAHRILCASTRESIEATAFLNPDGAVVTVAMNRTDAPQTYSIDTPAGYALAGIPAHSISTFTYKA